MSAGTWRLVIPAPCPWASTDASQPQLLRTAYQRLWRARTYLLAACLGTLPKGLGRIRVDGILHLRVRGDHARAAALYPTVAAAIAALGPPIVVGADNREAAHTAPGYGLVTDCANQVERPRVVEGELWRPRAAQLASVSRAGALELIITDITGQEDRT